MDQLIALLASVETATAGHFLAEGFMSPDLQCVTDDVRIAGRALTVRLPRDDGSALPCAISRARRGDILVIERGDDDRHACWGGVMTAAAVARGIAGVVVDGYVTDIGDVREAGLPVWCRGRSPLTTKLRGGGSVGQPIKCGGVLVYSGDIVLADENGVCVLSPDAVERILRKALAFQAEERAILERLRQGEDIAAIYGL